MKPKQVIGAVMLAVCLLLFLGYLCWLGGWEALIIVGANMAWMALASVGIWLLKPTNNS